MIEISLKMDDNTVQTRIHGKMYTSEVILMTNAFCSAMITMLQNAGMSEEDAQGVIASAALFASGISDNQ